MPMRLRAQMRTRTLLNSALHTCPQLLEHPSTHSLLAHSLLAHVLLPLLPLHVRPLCLLLHLHPMSAPTTLSRTVAARTHLH